MTDEDKLEAGVPVALAEFAGWEASAHVFEHDDLLAVRAAQIAKRPLLVRGEPGTGKTQLARAVAQANGWAFVPKAVTGLTELEDLFWHYDAVDRLAEAQVAGALKDDVNRHEQLAPRRFLSPGPLWWAFHWTAAEEQYAACARKRGRPHWPGPVAPPGVVLLIDEIDKADLDLPNGLLEAFGQSSFQVPWLEDVTVKRGDIPLLVVITTNEERELPRAFLRRCLVLNLEYPDADNAKAFVDWFRARGRVHVSEDACADIILEDAAELIRSDRISAGPSGIRPGLAEYVDLLHVVSGLHEGNPDAQSECLGQVSRFVRSKQGQNL